MIDLYHGDCLLAMGSLPDNSIDCVIADPPYFRVKDEKWDRQWDNRQYFIKWLESVATEWQRVLKPNGSLYCFASPQMSAHVEVMLGGLFEVLNNIRWVKKEGWHKKASKESARRYKNPWESCIFAEQHGADSSAKGETGYQAKCDSLRGFVFEPLRAYITGEFERAGMLNKDGKIAANIACGFSASAGGMASRHYFSKSQWQLPTERHYNAMRDLLNTRQSGEYLRREYEDLRREYEDLRREYEDLRREYEDLRRPFSISADVPYTDVWHFDSVRAYKGKHPCEKPAAMLAHMITASTKPGAVILDSFMGNGSTGLQCVKLGRGFVGIEQADHHFYIARRSIEQLASTPRLHRFQPSIPAQRDSDETASAAGFQEILPLGET